MPSVFGRCWYVISSCRAARAKVFPTARATGGPGRGERAGTQRPRSWTGGELGVSVYRNRMLALAKDQSVSSTMEDYLKTIYKLETRGTGVVKTNALAERLGVAASSASEMVRKLDEAGLVEHVRYRGARLTESGRRRALGVLRRHRLLELFLAEALGMSWDRVHDQAELLEHSLSDELEELI